MQKIFDVNNKEDMKLLWSIVPDNAKKIKKLKKKRKMQKQVKYINAEKNYML